MENDRSITFLKDRGNFVGVDGGHSYKFINNKGNASFMKEELMENGHL